MKTQAEAMRYLLEAHGWKAEQNELVKTIVGVVERLELQCKEANDRIEELKQDRAILFQDAERWRELGMGYCNERDDAREQLAAWKEARP